MPSGSSKRRKRRGKRVAATQRDEGGHVGDGGLAAPQPAVTRDATAAKSEAEILAECERVRQWGISRDLRG